MRVATLTTLIITVFSFANAGAVLPRDSADVIVAKSAPEVVRDVVKERDALTPVIIDCVENEC